MTCPPSDFTVHRPSPAQSTADTRVGGFSSTAARRTACRFAAAALLAVAGLSPVAAQSPVGLTYVTTPDVFLIFASPQLDYLAPYALGTYLQSLKAQKKFFDWTPSDRPTVVLNDFSDFGNAAATVLPHNTLRAEIEPAANTFETDPGSERMASLMNHELVHLATTDKATAQDRFWRQLFLGKIVVQPQNPESLLYSYLTVPRFTVPRWYLEGSAVFMETWMGGGIGRAQGGYDEMVFRAMVRDDVRFYDPLGLVSRGTRVDFQVGANAYLYGTRFFTYLAYAYSPEQVLDWLRRDEGSRRHYASDFERVFGISLDAGWQNWIAFEEKYQRANLALVRQQPITPQRNLSARPLGSVSRACADEASDTLYAAVRYPGVVEHIAALDMKTGRSRSLVDLQGAALYSVTSLTCDLPGRQLFWINDNGAWRDLMTIDLATGSSRMLLKDARIGEIAFDPADRSLWGVRHHDGLATLVQIPYPYTEWNQVHTFAFGTVPTSLDISPDGRSLSASVIDASGSQVLRIWSIERMRNGDMTPLHEHAFGQALPESFVYSPDGRYLYGSSYFTGVSNIFRYEPATDALEAVSNAESGFFRPVPLADGRLVVFSYSGNGFQPALVDPKPLEDLSAIRFLGTELTKKFPVVTTWQVPPPVSNQGQKTVLESGDYLPLQQMTLSGAYPVAQGYRNAAGFGYHGTFSDPLGFAYLGATVAWTPIGTLPNNERGHVDVKGFYLGWRAELSYNKSDFYDLFGPTKRGRAGYAAKIGYTKSLIYEPPRTLEVRYDLADYDQIKTLPDAQNVTTNFKRLLVGEVGLYYKNTRRSLGAVDDEKGILASTAVSVTRVKGLLVPQWNSRLDLGLALPVGHSSIWSRTAVGGSGGSRDNSVANFYFGGFGNNKIDEGEVKRYREPYSLPGFGINEIAGQSYVRQMVELNLPPLVFESLGTPEIHLQSLRPALFASKLYTTPTDSLRRTSYGSLGGQGDLRFSVLHWYETTLSVGYAIGFRENRRVGNEFMISLKIL